MERSKHKYPQFFVLLPPLIAAVTHFKKRISLSFPTNCLILFCVIWVIWKEIDWYSLTISIGSRPIFSYNAVASRRLKQVERKIGWLFVRLAFARATAVSIYAWIAQFPWLTERPSLWHFMPSLWIITQSIIMPFVYMNGDVSKHLRSCF